MAAASAVSRSVYSGAMSVVEAQLENTYIAATTATKIAAIVAF